MTLPKQTCPRCGSSSIETTTMGFLASDFDLNRASCYAPGCGWRGRGWETIAIGEHGNPDLPDVIRVTNPVEWQPGQTIRIGETERPEWLVIVARVDRDGRLWRVRREVPA